MSAISTRKYVYSHGTSFLFPRHQPYPPYPPYLSTRFQEMLRWLEYFDALDDKVAPKVKASDFSNGPHPKWLIPSWSEGWWSSVICLRGFNSVSQYFLWLSQCCRVFYYFKFNGWIHTWWTSVMIGESTKNGPKKVSPAIGLLEWLKTTRSLKFLMNWWAKHSHAWACTPSWEGYKVQDWWKLLVIIANKNCFASLPSDS